MRISLENDCCCIYTAAEKLVSDKYLNHYEDRLAGRRFFRTNRNDLVNLDCIAAIRRIAPGLHALEMRGGATIDLSRRKAQELRKIIEF